MVIINHNGQSYEITNFEEFRKKLLLAIGFQVESEIIKEINRLGLVDTGAFKGSIDMSVDDEGLVITSNSPHGKYLEFGTPGTKKGVTDPFGERNRGPNPTRKMPMKKVGNEWKLIGGLDKWAQRHGFQTKDKQFLLAKYIQTHGLEPRAPFRRVLYNEAKMSNIINRAVKAASK